MKKVSKKRISLRAGLLTSIFVLFLSISLLSFAPHTKSYNQTVIETSADTNSSKSLSPEVPIRLRIPEINTDAVVEEVGLTKDGAMDAPEGPKEVGWYKNGPIPGKPGTSVIDGHSGWKNGKAVFDDLHKLHKGDEIQIVDKNGKTLTFVVREIRHYNKDANTNDVFESHDGTSHLNLITCTGAWNKVTQTSAERLVVFSDLLTEI